MCHGPYSYLEVALSLVAELEIQIAEQIELLGRDLADPELRVIHLETVREGSRVLIDLLERLV